MKYIYIIGVLILCSCEKTITPDLNTVASQIVIQGEILDAPGPYTITINRSVDFYADNDFPGVTGAVVTIEDDEGIDSLKEVSPGKYNTQHLQGKRGHTYLLKVLVEQQMYTASTTMPQPVNLDTVTFLTTGGGESRISAVANFQDPLGVANYYRFEQSINNVSFIKDIFLLDDRLSDGRYITSELRMDSAYLRPGDRITVTMFCLDENVYNYWYQLRQSSGGGPFNTTVSPANPTSNISNGALGYFSAQTAVSKQTIVY